MNDFRESMIRFKQLTEYVKEEVAAYEEGKDRVIALNRIYELLELEAEIEEKNVVMVAKRKGAMKKILLAANTLEKELASAKEGYYKTRVFWTKHKENIFLVMDLIALAGAILSPPIATALFGATVARRVGIFEKISRLAGKESKISRILEKTVKTGYRIFEELNFLRYFRDSTTKVLQKVKDIFDKNPSLTPSVIST